MKVHVNLQLLAATAAVVLASGCSQLATPEIVEGIDGKRYRIDGYGLDSSLDRGSCTPEGKQQIEVNLKNNSRDAHVLYQITDYNLTPRDREEVAGEVEPGSSKKIIFTPTVSTDSVQATIVQLKPDGTVASKTQKIQGLDPRSCP